MSGKEKIVVLTGGTAGIGRDAAYKLSLSCRVIMGARSKAKGETMVKEFAEQGRSLTFVPLDLEDPASIQNFAKEVGKMNLSGIDVLVLNAGLSVAKEVRVGPCEVERTQMINHFGGFMLYHLLSPLLKKSSPRPRLVVVSSDLHDKDSKWHLAVGDFDFEKSWDNASGKFKTSLFNGSKKYDEARAYADSKLSNALFALRLARTEGSWLDVMFLNPGMTPGSDFPMYKGFFGFFARNIAPLMGFTVTVGEAGDALVEGSLRRDLKNGSYFSTKPEVKGGVLFGEHPHSVEADDEAKQDALWEISLTVMSKSGI